MADTMRLRNGQLAPPDAPSVRYCAPGGETAAILRGLGLDAGTADPDVLDAYRGAVVVVVPLDESADGIMRGAGVAQRLRGIAAKVVRGPTAADFALAAQVGADVSTWPNVAGAAELPAWTPGAAEAAALDAERQAAEGRAFDAALAAGADLPPADEPEPWEEPIPIDGAAVLPEFPLDALPLHVAEFVRELAGSLEVPPDMPAAFALGVGAAACQGRFRVHVRADHSEPLNLFVAVALPPAEMKSATIREALSPLSAYEQELQDRERENVARAEERHYVEAERRRVLRAQAAKAPKASDREAAARELEALAACHT
jgi:hypothetical protein